MDKLILESLRVHSKRLGVELLVARINNQEDLIRSLILKRADLAVLESRILRGEIVISEQITITDLPANLQEQAN